MAGTKSRQTDRQKRTLECARYYVSQGRQVLPLYSVDKDGSCLCGDPRCQSPGKHPYSPIVRNGIKNSTSNKDTVEDWFSGKYGDLNIGIAGGKDSGLVILDVDPRHGGDESLRQYAVPKTLEVKTGGGGQHLYFRHPSGDVRNSAGKLGPGLDVRGHHGFCVAPPSLHASGLEYKFSIDPRGADIAPCPDWILNQHKVVKTAEKQKSNVDPEEPIPHGYRNDRLFQTGRGLRRQRLDFGAIYAALSSINERRCEPPLDPKEVERIAKSAASYEAGKTRHRYHLTDLGNAERLRDRYGDKLRYCTEWGRWGYYDGQRWNFEIGKTKASQLAQETVRQIIPSEVDASMDREIREKITKHAFASESCNKLTAMLKVAQTLPGLVAQVSDFDQDLYAFNCANGTIDLRTGELRPHNPSDMISKMSPVEFTHTPDPVVQKLWNDHLDLVLQGNQDLIRFLQRMMGYTLTGDVREEKMFLIHGPAASGKTTTNEAVRMVHGEYGKTADFGSFLKSKYTGGGQAASGNIARLAGARYVSSVEVDKGEELAQSLLKQVTGRDTITARFLYKAEFEFVPQFTLVLVCNDTPRVRDTDTGIWRRLFLVPFNYSIPPEKRDPSVKDRLCNPKIGGPVVLKWMLDGFMEWQKHRLQVPEEVEEATLTYRQGQDPLKEFIEDECILGKDNRIPAKVLRTTYQEWCKECGIKMPLSPKKFNERLRKRGCEEVRRRLEGGNPMKIWVGITLADHAQGGLDTIADQDSQSKGNRPHEK